MTIPRVALLGAIGVLLIVAAVSLSSRGTLLPSSNSGSPAPQLSPALGLSSSTGPVAVEPGNCSPAAGFTEIEGLPALSPSGEWCRLPGLPECKAAWCNGFWGDRPTSLVSSVIYNCNRRQPNSNRGTCVQVTDPGELRSLQSSDLN